MMPRPRLQEEFAYLPPELKKVVSPAEKILQVVLVTVVGTGLGIGVGVFLAGRTLPPDVSTVANPAQGGESTKAPEVSKTQSVTLAEPKTQASPIVTTETVQSDAKLNPGAKLPLGSGPVATDQVRRLRLANTSLATFRNGLHHRHGVRRQPNLALSTRRNASTWPQVEEAKLEVPDGRFLFTIEGDQTAVAYDAQSGVVSTEGSGTFVVEKTSGEVPSVQIQETPANLHYKCDQDANCSLIMTSLVAPHARMKSISRTTEWAYLPISTDGQVRDGSSSPTYVSHVSR